MTTLPECKGGWKECGMWGALGEAERLYHVMDNVGGERKHEDACTNALHTRMKSSVGERLRQNVCFCFFEITCGHMAKVGGTTFGKRQRKTVFGFFFLMFLSEMTSVASASKRHGAAIPAVAKAHARLASSCCLKSHSRPSETTSESRCAERRVVDGGHVCGNTLWRDTRGNALGGKNTCGGFSYSHLNGKRTE